MWKNQTTPDLHAKLSNTSIKTEQKNRSNVCQLSFSQMQLKKQHRPNKQLSKFTLPISKQNRSQHQIVQQFMSRQSCSFDSKLDDKSLSLNNCKNVTREALILSELEQNQQLRINLFRAEKTILDLDTMCKVMHNKIVEIITSKKNQMENKLGTAQNSLSKSIKQDTSGKKTRKNKENQWQKISVGQKKHQQITQIWKSCYSDLIEYITKYTKDITFLTEQYRALEAKTEHYKKTEKKNKRNQKHLLKILHESSVKLQKSEQTAYKLIQDLKDRDVKIEEYHIENKNLKMKILENLQQIEKIRRDNKMNIRDSANYKEAYKSIQDEVSIQKKKLKEILMQMQNKQKLIQIHKNNEKMLQQRNTLLEEQLNESKKFSENLMQQYKNLTHKIDSNQQKISEKYQAAENMYEQRTKQYERYIQNMKKQREIMQHKNQLKFQKLQEELEKCKLIKTSLEKQLYQRSSMIIMLQQQVKQKSQKYANLEVDLQVHLNQKDRQIEYLEELRDIGLQKNEELKSQLEEVRGDMLLIIEQLKIKQLQIQKYKSYSDSSFTSEKKIIKKYSLKTLNNVIENSNFNSNSKTYMNKKSQINKMQVDIETNPSKDKQYNKCVESVDQRNRLKITPIQAIIIQENISAPETLIKKPFQIHNYDTVNNINSYQVSSSANNQSNNTKKKSQKSIEGIIWRKRNKVSEISQSFGQEPEQQPEPYPALDVQPEQQYTHYEDTNQFEEYEQCNQFEGLEQFEELNEQINEFIPQSSNQVTWENPVKRVNLNQIIIDDFQNDPMELQTPKIWKNSSPNALSFGLDPKQQKFFQKQESDQKKQNNLQKYQGIKVKNQIARSKFSLQNFQNKIMMQENAKLLLSMNNISFR